MAQKKTSTAKKQPAKKSNGFVNACVALVNKYMPDAFLFAVILTIVGLLGAWVYAWVQNPAEGKIGFFKIMLDGVNVGWYGSFWGLLSFAMQMALVIVTGSILANTPIVNKGLKKLAKLPKTPFAAVWLVAFVAIATGWLNWGASLVVSGILAKEVAKNAKYKVHYPLLIAAGYLGLAIWEGGFSSSVALDIASGTSAWFTAANGGTAAFDESIFGLQTGMIMILCAIAMPLVMGAMHPKNDRDIKAVDPKIFADDDKPAAKFNKATATPAQKIENSYLLNYIVVAMGAVAIFMYFYSMAKAGKKFDLTLNMVNFIFLIVAMALYGRPILTVNAVAEASSGAAGVILQFPFYSGLAGLMGWTAGPGYHSLTELLSGAFVSISTPATFQFFVFIAAGIVNFFVPSGGGQWKVQGPIMIAATTEFNAGVLAGKYKSTKTITYAQTAMSLAWGDAWTNLIQPFWALPLLAVAKLGARDIIGYCVIMLLVEFVICAFGFLCL